MQGYQISFFTQQNRRHEGKPLTDWLVSLAKEMGLPGATVFSGGEGYGHQGRIHSARFFELADQPQEVLLVASAEQSENLFKRLVNEDVEIFYVRTPVTFGVTGQKE
jgi:PII-like signaling protein